MVYTKAELKRELAAMGLTGNETILIHSSMRSIGPVEGGADTVLDALMEFFAEGLLLLPTHTWRFINEENRVFDVRRSPCCVGILPELFRQRPGVVRSLHPTHSMAAYGKGAAAYIEGELNANTPCTPGGCYDRLRAAHGKVLLLGVTHARNTFIHSVEEVLNVPNRLTDKPMQMTVVDEAGAQHNVYMRRHYNAQQPHISEDFVKLEQAYLDCGAARNTKFGDAACVLCDAEGLFKVTRHVLAPNPEAFVTEAVIPPDPETTTGYSWYAFFSTSYAASSFSARTSREMSKSLVVMSSTSMFAVARAFRARAATPQLATISSPNRFSLE